MGTWEDFNQSTVGTFGSKVKYRGNMHKGQEGRVSPNKRGNT